MTPERQSQYKLMFWKAEGVDAHQLHSIFPGYRVESLGLTFIARRLKRVHSGDSIVSRGLVGDNEGLLWKLAEDSTSAYQSADYIA